MLKIVLVLQVLILALFGLLLFYVQNTIEDLSTQVSSAMVVIEDMKMVLPEIEVAIENFNQLKQIMGLKFKRILFDNLNYLQLKKCLKLCKNKYQTEYSGNATLKNISQISKTGVDRISVGTITPSAKSFDTTLLF